MLKWFAIPFSTMIHLSWVALQGIIQSFIELDEAVVHVISLVSFLWLLFSSCLPSDGAGAQLRLQPSA